MKIKRFSGYSEAAPEGVTYQKSSQVITRYILDPLDSSVDTLEETLELEALYRPTQNIGWNLQRGGEIGVESGWYDIPENKLKHSMKTSEATRRGIAVKDTTEARAERARQNHLKSNRYKDSVKGEKNPRALLTEDNVKKIKYEMFPMGLSNTNIASIFNVKPYVISFIRTGKNWSYV